MSPFAPSPPRQSALPQGAPVSVQEPVRVAVDFRGPVVRPLAFLWRGRKITVDRVNMTFKRQVGDRFVWCFAVSDNANSYVLRYDPETMRWTLEEVAENE